MFIQPVTAVERSFTQYPNVYAEPRLLYESLEILWAPCPAHKDILLLAVVM